MSDRTTMEPAKTGPILVEEPKMHLLKLEKYEPMPMPFLVDLLNMLGIKVDERTEIYKNWPEMFEKEAQIIKPDEIEGAPA